MKRRFIKLATALIISIFVNYLIAWAAWIPIRWGPLIETVAGTSARWPEPVPTYWPAPQRIMTKQSLGIRIEEWINDQSTSDHYNFQSMDYRVGVFDSGWPLPCLRRSRWIHTSIKSTDTQPTRVTQFCDDLPSPSWWNWGVPMPLALDQVEPGWKRLPIRPIPLPLLANTAFWMLIFLSSVALTKFIRRCNRRHTNRCSLCGYDRAGLTPHAFCPECGSAAALTDSLV